MAVLLAANAAKAWVGVVFLFDFFKGLGFRVVFLFDSFKEPEKGPQCRELPIVVLLAGLQ